MKKYINLIALILFASTLHAMEEDKQFPEKVVITVGEMNFDVLSPEEGHMSPYNMKWISNLASELSGERKQCQILEKLIDALKQDKIDEIQWWDREENPGTAMLLRRFKTRIIAKRDFGFLPANLYTLDLNNPFKEK